MLRPRSPLRVPLDAVVMALLPGGLQQRARRNAWAGMSELSARGRARAEADAALSASAAAATGPLVVGGPLR